MKRDINFISLHLPSKVSNTSVSQHLSTKLCPNQFAVDTIVEHPYMQNIRKAVLKYRLQSAVHFDVVVRVEQALQIVPICTDWATDPTFKLKVSFADHNGPETYTCRSKFRTDHNKNVLVPRNQIMVVGSGRPMSLNSFLCMKFPAHEEEKVPIDSMQGWWSQNGKHFNWAGLPTELKELVVQNCVHQLMSRSQFNEKYRRHQSRWKSRAGTQREFGTFEIVDKLGDWASLLGVSHQVRAIALRLCFMGSSEMVYSKGFSIFTKSSKKLKNTLARLGRYYQMSAANGIPIDDETQALANCYKYYPRIYKHLDQYAAFSHGIRRISMTMDFLELMHFFKATVGGFERYIRPGSLSYEIFERLPNLAEIVIGLPGKPRGGWDNTFCRGPYLFHEESPCPRVLHRLIYERIVDTLTLYPRIMVQGFIDDDEQARFESLREAAMKDPKWTAEEYDELYAECGGGIPLDEAVIAGSWIEIAEDEDMPSMEVEEEKVNDYFPPECYCEEKCLVLFNERQLH